MISPFAQQVYKLLRTVPKGRVTTYKELAKAMNTNAFQAIGQIMRSNPYAPAVPCHRVVASNGMLGGFMGERSGPTVLKKIHLLKEEGVVIHGNRVIDFEKKLWRFNTKTPVTQSPATGTSKTGEKPKGRILQPKGRVLQPNLNSRKR